MISDEDEEFEEDEEDKEVARLFNQKQGGATNVVKRYNAVDTVEKYMYTVLNVFCSMSTLSTQLCMECIKFNCIHVNTVDTCIFSHLYGGCWTQDGDRGLDFVRAYV